MGEGQGESERERGCVCILYSFLVYYGFSNIKDRLCTNDKNGLRCIKVDCLLYIRCDCSTWIQ